MHRREIKSYVIREGRITPGQIRALQDFWPSMGLEVEDGLLDCRSELTTKQPRVLEIGFGMGDSLFEMVQSEPKTSFIGVEVHRPGVGHLLRLAGEAEVTNLKVYRADSIDVIRKCLPIASLDRVQIFFPDPWHKKKHHKRRLINPAFISLLAPCLKPGAVVHIATDWAPYAEVIEEVMKDWVRVKAPRRPATKYEKRGLKLNHKVFDLAFSKNPLTG